jgi:catechol 2,3-dioxygenase-like lactoylglutathione lyase family enzyme
MERTGGEPDVVGHDKKTGEYIFYDCSAESPKGRSDVKERAMLDHMILTVSNVERSLAFYEAALKPLNIKFFLPYKGQGDHPDLWGFGDGKRAFFWIKQGKPDPASIHWGFMAENNGKVDEFYREAISAGARGNISPRVRVEYYPGYYAADIFDPDGYSFEVVHKS